VYLITRSIPNKQLNRVIAQPKTFIDACEVLLYVLTPMPPAGYKYIIREADGNPLIWGQVNIGGYYIYIKLRKGSYGQNISKTYKTLWGFSGWIDTFAKYTRRREEYYGREVETIVRSSSKSFDPNIEPGWDDED